MVSRCSPAAPRRSAGSERRRSSCCRVRRIRRLRRGGRWRFPCWIGCPAVRPRQDAHSAAGAQDCFPGRHRRDRAAGTQGRRLDARWRSATCRSMRSPAPKPGCWCPPAAEGFAAGTPVDAYMLRGTDMSSDMSNAKRHLSETAATAMDQDQFLTILSREDALARFEAALFPRAIPSEQRPLADALGCALARGYRGADRRAAVRPFQCRRLCGALRRSCFRRRSDAGPPGAERRSHRLRHRADTAGAVGHRHVDRDRRSGAARRRRDRHGRAHPARRSSRDRDPPRRLARAIRLLCRLRHRARRGAAARRHRDRLARDRHAGGLRHRASCRSRAGRASPSSPPATSWCSRASRCAPPRSTTPTARSSPQR